MCYPSRQCVSKKTKTDCNFIKSTSSIHLVLQKMCNIFSCCIHTLSRVRGLVRTWQMSYLKSKPPKLLSVWKNTQTIHMLNEHQWSCPHMLAPYSGGLSDYPETTRSSTRFWSSSQMRHFTINKMLVNFPKAQTSFYISLSTSKGKGKKRALITVQLTWF